MTHHNDMDMLRTYPTNYAQLHTVRLKCADVHVLQRDPSLIYCIFLSTHSNITSHLYQVAEFSYFLEREIHTLPERQTNAPEATKTKVQM